MTDIDAQVAQFRDQLDHTAILNPQEFDATVNRLLSALLTPKEHGDATLALIRFAADHDDAPAYRDAVVDEAIAKYALYVVRAAGTWDVSRLTARLARLALAARISATPAGGHREL